MKKFITLLLITLLVSSCSTNYRQEYVTFEYNSKYDVVITDVETNYRRELYVTQEQLLNVNQIDTFLIEYCLYRGLDPSNTEWVLIKIQ